MGIQQIKEAIERELQQEMKVHDHMVKRLRQLPPGSLEERKVDGRNYYYQKVYVDDKLENIYLDPYLESHRKIIRELREKKTIIHGLPQIRLNISELRKCLPNAKPYHPANYEYGSTLGKEYYLEEDVCIKEWAKRRGGRNSAFGAGLIHDTKSGIKVRSKSEVLIADTLYDMKLMFKSETEIAIGGRTFYPDFEILHPVTHKVLLWEHMGKLYDTEYVRKNLEKIKMYAGAGFVAGVNLIITHEDEECPLTRGAIEKELRHHGLI